jgi:hypothetical protein
MSEAENNAARLEAALESADPFGTAFNLAVELRDGAMPQSELLAVFDASRARHNNDTDERRYDAVLDVMDLIVGWCSPGRALYLQPTKGT